MAQPKFEKADILKFNGNEVTVTRVARKDKESEWTSSSISKVEGFVADYTNSIIKVDGQQFSTDDWYLTFSDNFGPTYPYLDFYPKDSEVNFFYSLKFHTRTDAARCWMQYKIAIGELKQPKEINPATVGGIGRIIQTINGRQYKGIGTATLIDHNTIITALHVLFPPETQQFIKDIHFCPQIAQIAAGPKRNYLLKHQVKGNKCVKIKSIYTFADHGKLKDEKFVNGDIVFAQLEQSVDTKIKPVELAAAFKVETPLDVQVMGYPYCALGSLWGQSVTIKAWKDVREVVEKKKPANEEEHKKNDQNKKEFANDNMIKIDEMYLTSGASGGPAFYQNDKGKYIQVGVISMTIETSDPGVSQQIAVIKDSDINAANNLKSLIKTDVIHMYKSDTGPNVFIPDERFWDNHYHDFYGDNYDNILGTGVHNGGDTVIILAFTLFWLTLAGICYFCGCGSAVVIQVLYNKCKRHQRKKVLPKDYNNNDCV